MNSSNLIYSEKSASMNKQRIKKMTARNKLVEDVVDTTKSSLGEHFSSNQDEYKNLLKKLIVQVLEFI
jgi:hypothetical protein